MKNFLRLFLLLWLVSSCRGSRLPEKPAPGVPELTAQKPDVVQDSKAHAVAHATAHAEKPGILSGVGRIFSTPEGTARRQARKDVAATVPRKLGKGAVYAPAATEVVAAYKSKAPVINADSGAKVATATEGVAQAGEGNSATQERNGLPWWPFFLGGALVLTWIFRKTLLPFWFA
ncbi:hypothetical protein [Hymenobacter tenuis]